MNAAGYKIGIFGSEEADSDAEYSYNFQLPFLIILFVVFQKMDFERLKL
jgi:hypothetical protein